MKFFFNFSLFFVLTNLILPNYTLAAYEYEYTLHQVTLECERGTDKDHNAYTATFWGFSNQVHFSGFRTWHKKGGFGFQTFQGSKYNDSFNINGTGGYTYNKTAGNYL